MSVFSRFKDIVNSNINSMLEKAEDPEKLLKLMIQEMEDTLVDIKASCAGAMANRARVQRASEEARTRAENWTKKARLAVEKGREDLAREALVEKRNYEEEAQNREDEVERFDGLINQYRDDIRQLEDKLASARNKHRVLVQRHIAASRRKQAQSNIRKHDAADAMSRFDSFEQRIDRMEADADLINYGRKPSVEDEFARMELDENIEKELDELRSQVKKPSGEGQSE